MKKAYYYYQQLNQPKTEEVRYLNNNELQKRTITEKDFFIGCPDEEDARKGAEKTVQGELGVFTALNPVAGAATGVLTKPIGKSVEGIGEATGCKEAEAVGKGIQDSTEEPLKKVGDKVEEAGKDIEEGVKDLGNRIGSIFE